MRHKKQIKQFCVITFTLIIDFDFFKYVQLCAKYSNKSQLRRL